MTKAFVVGHPIKHSRSPLIHGYWLRQHGLGGSYERDRRGAGGFPGLPAFIRPTGFCRRQRDDPPQGGSLRGRRSSDGAGRAGAAVNTLWMENGILWGDNTDVAGFVDNLDANLGTGWEQPVGTVLVIGAGGAARAVIAGLQDRAFESHRGGQPHP